MPPITPSSPCKPPISSVTYREEYMSALLSVQRDDLSKVSTFLDECRRLKHFHPAPDVNFSQLDFDIETTEDGARAIRFGLGAVKNAGAGALGELVVQRGEAPFSKPRRLLQTGRYAQTWASDRSRA